MSIILDTQEAEIRRIVVPSQLRQKTLPLNINKGWRSDSSDKSTCLASVRP
jgi:hypothetical protein